MVIAVKLCSFAIDLTRVVMETVSSLLARLSLSGGSKKKESPANLENLPDSLRQLVESINRNTSGRDTVSKIKENAAAKRQNQINELQRQFNSNVQELADVAAMLNATQSDALKQAEKRANRDEERRKRDDAARRRAEKLSAVKTRQTAAKNEIGVGLVSALFGKGIGDFVANTLKAREQTKTDIAELSEARYADKIATAADQKADKIKSAEIAKDAAIAKATASYKEKLEEQTTSLGGAILEAKKNDAVLARTEAAKARLEDAKASRNKIEAEGSIRLAETSPGKPVAAETAPKGAALGASSIKENAAAPVAPIIVTPSGEDASTIVQAERTRKEVAARNLEADAVVSRLSDEFAEASREEGAAPAAYSGAAIQGEASIAETKKAGEETAAAIQDAIIKETNSKAEAVDAESLAKNEADAQKSAGALVSKEEQKSIGTANLMTGAVAPPALVIVGKVMEKFQNMFPVIEQTGNALIEMATVLPATMFTVMGQLSAGLTYALSQLRDVIRAPDVRKRYAASDAIVVKKTGKSRADLFAAAQEENLEAYKTASYKMAATSDTMPSSRGGLGTASRGPVRANAEREYTVVDSPTTAAGVAREARTVSEAREKFAPPAPVPDSQDRALGVIPVGPSNGSVDSWR